MLIDVGVAFVWLAISVAGALVLSSLAGGAVLGGAACEREPFDPPVVGEDHPGREDSRSSSALAAGKARHAVATVRA